MPRHPGRGTSLSIILGVQGGRGDCPRSFFRVLQWLELALQGRKVVLGRMEEVYDAHLAGLLHNAEDD